jgi:OHCU decarboxylase
MAEVQALDRDGFVARFGGVYEATPELAVAAWGGRPFPDRAALVAAFAAAADALDEPAVLALLRAHPQLAATAAMSHQSRREQQAAGLTVLDPAGRDQLQAGNVAYLERFGFPFIIAVAGLGPDDIARELAIRLGHDRADELPAALEQVKRIAALRLEAAVIA